jgi:ABC-type antimicrobial peptide transport system permease subunit
MRILKLSLRTLVHHRTYSIINLLGFALSLTCVVIIARYVHSELTVDGFNKNLDRVFITTVEYSNNQGKTIYSGIYNPKGEKNFADISEHPGVEKHSLFVCIYSHGINEVVFDNQTYEVNLLAVDTTFLQILDYPVIAGTNNIRRPEDVFLSETFAAKLFGKENPVGKTLFYSTVNKPVTVAGVIRTPTNKSVLSFDMLANMELRRQWGIMPHSLILLRAGIDYRDINRQYDKFVEMPAWAMSIRYQLAPYKNVYFDKNIIDYRLFPHGNLIYIFILTSIGVLLLIIGLTNYINIQSVVMTRRNKELGMKKVFGAAGSRIFMQLLVENLLLIVVALIIAFWFAAALHPFMENTFDVRQYPNLIFDIYLALTLVVALPVAVSVSPYLRYRYFSPVRSLRSVNSGGNKSLFSRKFFLCFQYFITMGLIVVSFFFVKQLNFMLDKDLGFRTENVIKAPFIKTSYGSSSLSREESIAREKKNEETVEMLKQRLNTSTLPEHWSFGNFPVANSNTTKFKVGDRETDIRLFSADETWLKLFNIQLLDGRMWDNETDRFDSYDLIVSESVLKQFGITDYRDAKLQPSHRLWWSSGRDEEMNTNPPYSIAGVVKDLYTEHLSRQSEPVAFSFYKMQSGESVIVSFAPERRQEVIGFMKNLHNELIGGDFTYSFIEDEIAVIYNEDKKVAMICTVFTGIAIFISMLGLLGISLFDIRQRRKEIAIRKINGAEIIDIVRLLLKKYFVLLGVAFAVATPVALFVIQKYLENFAYKAPVSWWLFAVALVVTVAVSLMTLLYQTYKAGNENPADVIKSET